jgi:hypothetical protein
MSGAIPGRRLVCAAGVVCAVAVVVGLFGSASAVAASGSPWWVLTSSSRPSVWTEGVCGGKAGPECPQVAVIAENLGDAGTSGPVTITDVLPADVKAIHVKGVAGPPGSSPGPVACSTAGGVKCTFEKNTRGEPGSLLPFETIEVLLSVEVRAGAESGEVNTATVSGGGAAARSTSHAIEVESGPGEAFGFEEFSLIPENEGGGIDTQAGSHPYQLTSLVTLNAGGFESNGTPTTVGLPKTITAQLPAGLVGNPTPVAQCSDAQFGNQISVFFTKASASETINECPESSVVGVATLTFNEPNVVQLATQAVPLFNLAPLPGEPARFGFKVVGALSATLDTSVRSGGDYGVDVSSLNIAQISQLLSIRLTFWGVPGAVQHDHQRGWYCLEHLSTEENSPESCPDAPLAATPPFLSLPTSCAAAFEPTLVGESWGAGEMPAVAATPVAYRLPVGLDGCNRLPFAPEIRAAPDSSAASSSSGLDVDVHVPQQSVLHPESLAESGVRDITVALPEGVSINPSGSDGLEACSEALVGFTGLQELAVSPGSQTGLFTPSLPEPLMPGVNFCPDASKIGTATIHSPLLANPLVGSVYLATQNQNPFGSLVAMYVVVRDPVSGTLVKLAGQVSLTSSGQIVTTFANSPELPFEDAELDFFGGERAPLATPSRCGRYTTDASFTPWSGGEPVASSSTFEITHGPNGSPCPGASLPFRPSLTVGTSNISAGAFSPLTSTIGREDGEQSLQSVSLHMPNGLEGLLAGVKLCGEAQANEGTCGAESLIGETTVSAGVGSDPVAVTGGRVYLTESYGGAPFGLSIVNPVKAGPFDLEHDTADPNQDPACDCVVVRAKIEVNPHTAELTVVTDPSGPHAIPHMIDGIPVQIKKVNVVINRPHFIINPTSCNPLAVTGSIGSDESTTQALSVPFQIANCENLKFQPKLEVSTPGQASKANGAGVSFKVSYPPGALGSQSWFNEAKFQFPRQLPARLQTIQKACLASVFETNRGACPPQSIIGHAIVHTPILPVPLEGPVYFVSYGATKFPDAVFVVKGYGVTIELHGETFINGKTGITTATFRDTPDVPFESLEVTLPTGPYSEFGVNLPDSDNYNLCGQKLVMPTFLKASNGDEVHQETPVTPTGCPTKLKITSHKTRGQTITLTIYIPAAGKLNIQGQNIKSASKSTAGTEAITLTLHAKQAHHRTRLKVTFKPSSKSHTQQSTITLTA